MSDHYGSISINPEKPSKNGEVPTYRQPPPPPKKRRGGGRGILITVLATLFIASYFLSARYLAPMAIHKYLPGYLLQSTGLTFSMGQVELNPFNFQLSFSDISADTPQANTEKPLLQIPSLFVDMDLTSLLRNSFVCDTLSARGLSLNIIRFKDKSYNLPVLSRLSEEENQEMIIDFTNLPFLFSFNNIDINDGHILFTDEVTDKTHTVEQLHLAIPSLSNFSFQSENYIQPHFSALINNSRVELAGKTRALEDGEKYQTRLTCSINELDLIPYFSYLPTTFPLLLSKGVVDLKLEVAFSPEKEQGQQISIDMQMEGSGIFMHTKKGNNKISLPSVQLDATLTPVNKRLHIKSIVADKPQLVTSQEQLPRGLANFLSTAAPPSKRLGISIDNLLLDKGRLVLSDKEDSVWTSLQLSIKDFDSTRGAGSFHLSGKQATGSGSFAWQGQLSKAGGINGKILLNKFPASTIIKQLQHSPDSSIKGETELSGDLNLAIIDKETTAYSLNNVTLQFHKLELAEADNLWLQADSVRFTRLSRQGKRFHLGNIFLKDASLHLVAGHYPPLFSLLFRAKKRPAIQGLDFLGELTLKQQGKEKENLHLSDIKFQTNRLDKHAAAENFVFTAKLGPGGVIQSKGKLTLAPTKLQTNITFSDLDSALLAPLLTGWPLLQHSAGILHGEGRLTYPKPSFQGTLRLDDTSLRIEKERSFLNWDMAKLNEVKCTFSPFSLTTTNLELHNPQLQYNVDLHSPFQQLAGGLQQILANNSKAEDLFNLQIQKISLLGGVASLLDTRTSPPWAAEVKDLSGRITNLKTVSGGTTSFGLKGALEGAPFGLSGSVALFQEQKDVRLRLNLTDFPLHSFAEQLATSPTETDNASISLQSKYSESGSAIDSTTEMSITNLLPAAIDTNTALALALLKDSNGTFQQTIRMDDRNRSLFQESVSVFQTTLIKASYAPLLLDPKFGDLQENNFISFQPGTNTINIAGKEALIRHSELLAAHPNLALSVTGVADAKTDRLKLAKATPPAQPRTIDDEELLELAQERSLVVYDFFIHSLGIAPARVSISASPLIQEESPAKGAILDIRALPPAATPE